MKKLFIIVVVIAMLTTMSTAGFAAENEIVASRQHPTYNRPNIRLATSILIKTQRQTDCSI